MRLILKKRVIIGKREGGLAHILFLHRVLHRAGLGLVLFYPLFNHLFRGAFFNAGNWFLALPIK